jgi:5'-deoxynucleotidase YfbR-like HD superfamily hydrolase
MSTSGSAIQTYSGRRFSPLEPDAAQIDIRDIAHALANLCRFGGHCSSFYSIGQHSCVVADAVEASAADATTVLCALLHDASEAYLGDLPHPVKHRSPLGDLYREIEAPLQAAILARFGLPADTPPLVKRIDRAALAAERVALMRPADDEWWPELDGVEALEIAVESWEPGRAAREFLARFERLEAQR